MKKMMTILCCISLLLTACGKDEEQKDQDILDQTMIKETQKAPNIKTLPQTKSAFINAIEGDPEKFLRAFSQMSDAKQYYFCSAFAMGAMSVSKPVTVSAMVNYFMGLGVTKYQIGINDDTYEAFNAGKNVFLHESLVNTILKRQICENIMNDATEYAHKNKLNMEDLDKLGKIEVGKVVEYIKKEKH